jgi:hypothetical protein
VEDALFCHRCGKPQREDLIEREAEPLRAEPIQAPIEPPLPTAAPVPQKIDFGNRSAVRASLWSALTGFLLMSIVALVLGGASVAVTLFATGFFAVHIYVRATRTPVTAKEGAKIGWITGIFAFLLALVQFTLTIALEHASLRELFQKQFAEMAARDPNVQAAADLINSSAGLATLILAMVVGSFIFFTVMTMLGGALGSQTSARFAPQNPQPRNPQTPNQ